MELSPSSLSLRGSSFPLLASTQQHSQSAGRHGRPNDRSNRPTSATTTSPFQAPGLPHPAGRQQTVGPTRSGTKIYTQYCRQFIAMQRTRHSLACNAESAIRRDVVWTLYFLLCYPPLLWRVCLSSQFSVMRVLFCNWHFKSMVAAVSPSTGRVRLVW